MDELTLSEVAEEAGRVYRVRSRRALKRLPKASRELARLCDGRRSLREVCEQAGVSLTHALGVIDRLSATGVLIADEPAREVPFTDQEEAFFASEVLADEEIEEPAPRSPRWMGRLVDRLRDRLEVGLLDSSPSLH